MKYLISFIVLLALSGCTMNRQTKTKVHLFNPFYPPGGNPVAPVQRYSSHTDANMGMYR